MTLELIGRTARVAALHGAALGLAMSIIGTATAQEHNTRPVPPPPNERPTLPPPPPDHTVIVIPAERIYTGWSMHPLGASDPTASVADNTIQLFKGTEFHDSMYTIENVTAQ